MNIYLYKGEEAPGLFLPIGLLIDPFVFPASARKVLKVEPCYLYFFKDEPSETIVNEHKLTKSLVLEGFEKDNVLEELKAFIKPISFWKAVSLF